MSEHGPRLRYIKLEVGETGQENSYIFGMTVGTVSLNSLTRSRGKKKTTFGEVLIGAFTFIVADIVIAFTPLGPILLPLGTLEVIAMVVLVMRATWDALPRRVRSVLG